MRYWTHQYFYLYYYDFFNLGTQDKKQEIGNTIQISYSKKYPRYNMVEKLYSQISTELSKVEK